MEHMFFLFIGVFTVVQGASIEVECRNDTECAPIQCCYIQPEFLVVSRRVAANPLVVALQPPHTKHDTGKCQNFKVRGEPCGPLDKLNGQCGCGSGMTCQWVSMGIPPTIDSPIIRQGKRRIFHPPGPGSFQCAS